MCSAALVLGIRSCIISVGLFDVDIILTGDKDFLSLEMDHPKCMTAVQFLESEGVGE